MDNMVLDSIIWFWAKLQKGVNRFRHYKKRHDEFEWDGFIVSYIDAINQQSKDIVVRTTLRDVEVNLYIKNQINYYILIFCC